MVEPIYILVSKAGTVIAALKSFDSAKKKYLEFYSLYPKIADDYLSIQAIELKD